MTAKNYAYDDVKYLTRLYAGGRLSGNAGMVRFAAWTDTLVKSIEVVPATAGTAADIISSRKITQGTATTTAILTTYASDGLTPLNFTSTFTLAAGDSLQILKGADATGDYAVGIELALVNGATVTE